jgi:hypothetical protein
MCPIILAATSYLLEENDGIVEFAFYLPILFLEWGKFTPSDSWYMQCSRIVIRVIRLWAVSNARDVKQKIMALTRILIGILDIN